MYSYVLVLTACLVLTIPLEFIFELGVLRNPLKTLRSIWLPIFVYLLWDIVATHFGHWSFSNDHTLSIKILGLPVEEYLFFIVVPLCGLLTLGSVKKLSSRSETISIKNVVFISCLYLTIGIIIQSIWSASTDSIYPDRGFPYYAIATLFASIFFAIYVMIKKRSQLVFSKHFVHSLFICLFFMIFVNGFLTKLNDPIVTYANNLGPRIFFDIPIEDFFYGSVLLLWIFIRYHEQNEKVSS